MKNEQESKCSDRGIPYWYAIYTRSRFEKKVHRELRSKGLESFLPLKPIVRSWSDRKKETAVPWFPSYLFVRATLAERLLALQTLGAVRLVSFGGVPSRIPDCQIEAVRRILDHGQGYNPQPLPYMRKDDNVRITSGPFKGLIGFLLENRGKNRFVVSLNPIHQSIAIEIDAGSLKLL